jgi:hypothetical protein
MKQFSLTISLLLFSSASLAMPKVVYAQANACQAVIDEAVYSIERLPNISVPSNAPFEISDIYRNPPQGRVMGYYIGMEGSAVDNVFNSPVMMENIATRIFDACNRVGMVEFGIHQAGYAYQIGWSSNGPIIFDCVRDDWHSSGESQINWGQQICGM